MDSRSNFSSYLIILSFFPSNSQPSWFQLFGLVLSNSLASAQFTLLMHYLLSQCSGLSASFPQIKKGMSEQGDSNSLNNEAVSLVPH